jgi:hypothetical protein
MRTTVDFPDDLFRQAKAKAAMEGVSLKELLTGYVVSGLQRGAPPPSKERSRLPVIKRHGRRTVPNLSGPLQASLDEEEDLAAHRRSFGR